MLNVCRDDEQLLVDADSQHGRCEVLVHDGLDPDISVAPSHDRYATASTGYDNLGLVLAPEDQPPDGLVLDNTDWIGGRDHPPVASPLLVQGHRPALGLLELSRLGQGIVLPDGFRGVLERRIVL